MDPSIPIDIIENVIDQASDNPQSLRQLTLTCSRLLPRSRYHLLAWHVCLRNKTQLDDFYAYLRANPHMRPVIRTVKLRIPPRDISGDEARKKEGLLSMIPVPLLTFPKLRYWRIQSELGSYGLDFGSPQLACLRVYTTSITSLDMLNVEFLNVTEPTRFIFAFPALCYLHLSWIYLWKDVMGITFGPARERHRKQLHLTSLKMRGEVHQSVMALLLEIGRSMIEDLGFEHWPRYSWGTEHVQDLVCSMQALRSITITSLHVFHVDDDVQVLVYAWEMMMRLHTSPTRTHTVIIDSARLGDFDYTLANEALLEKNLQLERFFLSQTPHSIVFTAPGMKRRRKTFWTTALGRYFPELHQRGRLRIQDDKLCDAYQLTGHDASVCCLAISSDSEWIASGSLDTTIILWDARQSTIVQEWLTYAGYANYLAFSPDTRLLVSGCRDCSVVTWDVNEGCKRVATLCGHRLPVLSCVFSPDGTLLASGDGMVLCLWDTQSFTQLNCFENGSRDWSPYVRFSPDLRWFVFWRGTDDCEVRNMSDGHLHKTLSASTRAFSCAAFDPMSKRIVISTPGYTLSIWDIETAEEHLILRGHKDVAWDINFSPNGEWVLSASNGRTAKMWDSHTGELILSFEGHTDAVYSSCFSPDGRYVASVSKDKTVRLWRTSDGSCVRTFTEHTDSVMHVLFSPDGKTLWSGADDGTVFVRQLRDVIALDFAFELIIVPVS